MEVRYDCDMDVLQKKPNMSLLSKESKMFVDFMNSAHTSIMFEYDQERKVRIAGQRMRSLAKYYGYDVFITERQRQKKLYISKLTTDDDVKVYVDVESEEE